MPLPPLPAAVLRRSAVALLVMAVAACGDTGDPTESATTERDVTPGWSHAIEDRTASYSLERWSERGYEATDLRFLPDGSALVITKGGWTGPGTGTLALLDPEGRHVRDLLQVPVCADAERGLLGLEIDPDFETQPLVYLYYTRQMSDCSTEFDPGQDPPAHPVWNRLSSFRYDPNGIDPGSEVVLLDEIPGHQSAHNGGGLAFMADGTLLVSTGEGAYGRSQELDFPSGKVLRLDVRNGGEGAADNPFNEPGASPTAARVYALGFRNPFRIAVEPESQAIAVGDVGTDVFEEIDLVVPGGDYGFPTREGPGPAGDSIEPALWYRHDTDPACGSVIGGTFVPPELVDGGATPYFTFSDFICGGVWAASVEGDEIGEVLQLAPKLDIAISAVRLGPDLSLLLIPIGPGPQQILRLTPAGG